MRDKEGISTLRSQFKVKGSSSIIEPIMSRFDPRGVHGPLFGPFSLFSQGYLAGYKNCCFVCQFCHCDRTSFFSPSLRPKNSPWERAAWEMEEDETSSVAGGTTYMVISVPSIFKSGRHRFSSNMSQSGQFGNNLGWFPLYHGFPRTPKVWYKHVCSYVCGVLNSVI